MGDVAPRPLTATEGAIVSRLLALHGLSVPGAAALAGWRVVGRCDCGCASVDFVSDVAPASVLADGYGVTPGGVPVGVILWQRDGVPSGLEVYMLGEDTPELPAPESLHRGEGAPAG